MDKVIVCSDESGIPDKWENSDKWLCSWIKCVFGLGLAGMGRCPGNPFVENCEEFLTEDEAFDKWWPDREKV